MLVHIDSNLKSYTIKPLSTISHNTLYLQRFHVNELRWYFYQKCQMNVCIKCLVTRGCSGGDRQQINEAPTELCHSLPRLPEV